MAETAQERKQRLTNEMMKGTGVTADDLSEWLAYTDEEIKAESKSNKKKAQKKRIQKQREAAKEKGKKSAKKLSPKLVESAKKKRESWILPEGEEMTWKPTPSQLRAMAKKDREVAKYAPQFKKAVEESEETGVLGSKDHSLKYRGEAPKRNTGSPSFYPSDPGAREKISNQTFRKAAGDRIKRLRHERAIMQSRPTLEQGTERWQKRPDSEEMHEQYMDMSGTEKQLGDEEMPGLMNLYETDRDARIKRADEYKQFSDEASLSAQERARRGEKPIIEKYEEGQGLLEESLPLAMAVERGKKREAEEERMDALRRKYDRGTVGGGEAIDLDDPENRKLKEDLIPQYKGGSRYRGLESVKGGRGEGEQNYGMDSEALSDLREDQASEIQAQQDMQNMSEDEQNQVIQTVQDQMGPQSEQAIAAKEATGRYVRYEGSGFVINKSKLDKAFDRQRKMKMLQHLPQKARASMLYKWGFIDKEDLNETQQMSAKEMADLNLTNIRIEQIKQSIEKQGKDMNKKEMKPEDKVRYGHLSTGYIKALSDKNWDLAKELAAQAKDMGYAFSGSSVDQLQQNTANAEIKAFKKLPRYKQMTEKYGDTLVNQVLRYKEKLMTQTTPPVGKKGAVNDLFQIPIPEGAQVEADTYGDFLRTKGFDSFENISKDPVLKKKWANKLGVPVEQFVEQDFNAYVFPEIRKVMLESVYGSIGTEIEGSLGYSVSERVDELDKQLNNPESQAIQEEYEESPIDSGVEQNTIGMIEKQQADEKARQDAAKAKQKQDEEKTKEAKKINEIRNEVQTTPTGVATIGSGRTDEEVLAEAEKEGEKLLRRKFLTQSVSGSGRGIKVEPARFKSLEEAIKHFKDPKNKKELDDLSPSIKHFISTQ